MQKSPSQQSVYFKDDHQDSNKFIHGDLLVTLHAKHSATYFLKHRVRFREIVKLWYNNINFVIVTFLMQRCISVLSGLCSNKSSNPTFLYAATLRSALYKKAG